MEVLMIIILVIGLIARANKTKQAQEEARRKKEAAARAAAMGQPPLQQRAGQQGYAPPTPPVPTVKPTVTRKPDPRFFDTEEDDEPMQAQIRARMERERQERERRAREQEQKRRAQQMQQTRPRVAATDDEPEGTAFPGSLTASIASTMSSTMIQPKGRRHTLEAASVTGHAHAETSLTGLQSDADCPTQLDGAARSGSPAAYTFGARALSFDRDAVVNGILYAEILGKPKALRRRA